MVHRKTGTMPSMIFAFSTWVTLQSFHGFLSFSACSISVDVWIAALSNHLQISKILKDYRTELRPDFPKTCEYSLFSSTREILV